MGGTNDDRSSAIALDSAGNVYSTGIFQGTADFDPGPGTSYITSAGGDDIFVSKLDSSGAFGWAQGMGGPDSDQGYDIAADSAGNVYTTGRFESTADFDPGPGTTNLTSAGSYDICVSKLDNSGTLAWARAVGGAFSDYGYGIAVDSGGDVLTTGYFQSTVDFDPGPGTSNLTGAGGADIFVWKLEGSPAMPLVTWPLALALGAVAAAALRRRRRK